MKSFIFILLLFIVTLTVKGLEPFDKFEEGPCNEIMSKPPKVSNSPSNIDFKWVDTLQYNSAGNKFHMYKMASPHPRYDRMTEDEFYYDYCYKRNTTSTSPIGSGTGFGRTLEIWDVRTRPDLPGVYIEATPRNHFPKDDVLRQRITLTDHKTFVFLLNCWMGSNKRSWNIVSNTPKVSPDARKLIESHAAALGFSRSNFIFLRYDSCEAENPFILGKRHSNMHGLSGSRLSAGSLKKPPTTTTTTSTTKRPPLQRITIGPRPDKHRKGPGWLS